MSRSKQVPAAERSRGRLQGSDVSWVIAFLVPYGAVFLAFAAYPIAYGIWMGRDPALYRELFSDLTTCGRLPTPSSMSVSA